MNRGSHESQCQDDPKRHRFNEAPIHESGKYIHPAAMMRPDVLLQ